MHSRVKCYTIFIIFFVWSTWLRSLVRSLTCHWYIYDVIKPVFAFFSILLTQLLLLQIDYNRISFFGCCNFWMCTFWVRWSHLKCVIKIHVNKKKYINVQSWQRLKLCWSESFKKCYRKWKKEKIMKLSERIKGKPSKIRSLKIDKKLIDIHQTHELHFNDRSCLNY